MVAERIGQSSIVGQIATATWEGASGAVEGVGKAWDAFSRWSLDLSDKDPEIKKERITHLLPCEAPRTAGELLASQGDSMAALFVLVMSLMIEVKGEERYLKAQEKAMGRDHHLKWVQFTQKEIEETANQANKMGWLSVIGAAAVFLPKLLVTRGNVELLQSFDPTGFAQGLPTDPVSLGDFRKSAQQYAQLVSQFPTQKQQTYSQLLQSKQYGGQTRAEKAKDKMQSAAGAMSMLQQRIGKDADTTMGVLQTWAQVRGRAAQAA